MIPEPTRFSRSRTQVFILAAFAVLALSASEAGAQGKASRKKPKEIPVLAPEPKKKTALPAASNAVDSSESGSLFEEIEFGNTLVIEGKVEKPQVQFTLIKEPPPEKEIRFETSFMQNILKHERENTFDAAERYGKD